MRYLTQLARETTARVLPPRQPSWLRPVPPLVQESMVEWPATPAESASLPGRVVASVMEPHATVERITPGDEPAPPALPEKPFDKQAPEAASPSPLKPQQDPIAGPSETASKQSPASAAAAPAPASAVLPAPAKLPEPLRKPADLAPLGEVREPAPKPAEPATLPWVLKEIARRQVELEIQYRTETVSEREPPRREIAAAAERAQPEREEVHLNIGSIVVQVEPDPAPAPAPRTAPRPAPRKKSSSWARSFLDR